MEKRFNTYEELIQRLKDKGLTVLDEKMALETLSEIGYYSLVCGYKQLLKDSDGSQYRQDTCFEDIVTLYSFDQTLRNLFLTYLIQFEKAIKARIAYTFCQKYGVDQNEYLNIANYNVQPTESVRAKKLMSILNDLATKQMNFH